MQQLAAAQAAAPQGFVTLALLLRGSHGAA
jgi:hypothetical protein